MMTWRLDRGRLAFIGYLFSILLSATLAPSANADFETEIAAEGGKWARYYEQENLEGLMTLYVDDAVVALHGQPALFGIGAIRDYFSTRIGKAQSVFELD